MPVGKLRHRVEIQGESISTDDGGGGTKSWTKVATVWASVMPIKGGERLRAMQLEDSVTHRVRIRFRSDVTAKNRLLFRSRPLNVRSMIDVSEERERFLELMCEEGVAT